MKPNDPLFPQLVHHAAHPKRRRPLAEIFPDLISSCQKLDIAVGYVDAESLRYLHQIALDNPAMQIEILCGMQGIEGMTEEQHLLALKLHEALGENNQGHFFVTRKIRYHGKIYVFRGKSETKAYVGSSNLSGIVDQHSDIWEAGVLLDSNIEAIDQHLEVDLKPFRVPLDKARIPTIASTSSKMAERREATAVPTSTVAQIFKSPAQYEFEIPIKTSGRSSLNAYLGGQGSRKQKTGHSLARDWYEGELIVDKHITSQPGYPRGGVPFTVVTHDGWSFECKTSGQNSKNLRSSGKLSTFGTWIKQIFVEAGVLQFGERVTEETLRRFRRNTLSMKYHPEHEVWSFDLSRPDSVVIHCPRREQNIIQKPELESS
ncbi:restriction endonuclease PLD domain-containing protein [Corynebacterium resistens]|nr:restriction endonuclease PLD domain-containing protein [Corynebacterium resistens]